MRSLSLADSIANLVQSTDEGAIRNLELALQSGTLSRSSSPADISLLLDPASIPLLTVCNLMEAWHKPECEAVSADALSVSLEAALQVRLASAKTSPEVTLVWTGPFSPETTDARPTIGVLREMLDTARFRIFVSAYNLGHASEATRTMLIDLATARARGCSVVMAIHGSDNNMEVLRTLWPPAVPRPRLLQWVSGHETSILHAKVVAVDDNDLLVTSANLSWHGLERNIEVGIRVKGPTALQVVRHFAALERMRVIVPIDWW